MTDPRPTALRMRLLPGAADEYRRRHDAIWPELAAALRAAGVSDYTIHLDEGDGVTLFAVLTVAEPARHAALSEEPVMRRWWDHMRDLMETDDEGRPSVWPLARVFDLP